MYHRSIALPNGDIFLTGGIDVENKTTILNNVYKMNYENNTLDVITSMYKERNSHGICFAKECLYVVGGNSSESTLDNCEKYDFARRKWVKIASLNQ